MVDIAQDIRIAARALVIQDHKVLAQHKVYDNGEERFTLPGGAPYPGEPLEKGLIRECQEEIGAKITVFELMHIADLFKRKKSVANTIQQQVEIIFRCDVPMGYKPRNGKKPDQYQVNVVWLDIEQHRNKFFPQDLVDIIIEPDRRRPAYLGLIK